MAPRVRLEGLSRSFPGVRAVHDVSADFEPGRLYGLVGENGAGKTTLMRLLYGMLRPDAGRIVVDDVECRLRSSQEAIALGLGMVHQHFMLVDTLSVAENVVLGAEPGSAWRFDRGQARRAVREAAERFDIDIDPDLPVGELGVGQAQMVEILKVLYRGAEFLIFDEPTGVLSPQESRFLFDILRRLTAEGKTVVLITHKLDEVLALADTVDVMRRGEHVGRLAGAEADAERLARLMVGRDVLLRVERGTRARSAAGRVLLSADHLELERRSGRQPLHDVSLELREGEILGIAGVEGNGQRELAGILTGLLQPDAGQLHVDGENLTALDPRRARQLGIRHVPEDRQRQGLVLSMSLRENLILGEENSPEIARWGLQQPERIAALAAERIAAFDLRSSDPGQSAGELSGGNQQKLILARELAGQPRVLVASQPTRGVDVGAIEAIHRQLLALREEGLALLLVSSELPELLGLSDRIAVFYRGRQVACLDVDADLDEEELGLWMTGAKGGGDA